MYDPNYPLMHNNFLGEFKTEAEKLKARENLGLTDEKIRELIEHNEVGNIFTGVVFTAKTGATSEISLSDAEVGEYVFDTTTYKLYQKVRDNGYSFVETTVQPPVGCVIIDKHDDSIYYNGENELHLLNEDPPQYVLPVATEEVLGGVKSDGNTVNIDANGVLSVNFPVADENTLGGVILDGNTTTLDGQGKLKIIFPEPPRPRPISISSDNMSVGITPMYEEEEIVGYDLSVDEPEQIPKRTNELIYSENGEDLTTKPFMYTNFVVVDNSDDLERCMSERHMSPVKMGMKKVLRNFSIEYANKNSEYSSQNSPWQYDEATDSIYATDNRDPKLLWCDISNHYYIENDIEVGFYQGIVTNDGIGFGFMRRFTENGVTYTDSLIFDVGNRKKNGALISFAVDLTRMRHDITRPNGEGIVDRRIPLFSYTCDPNNHSCTVAPMLVPGSDVIPVYATGDSQTYFVKINIRKVGGVITITPSVPYLYADREESHEDAGSHVIIDLENGFMRVKGVSDEDYTEYDLTESLVKYTYNRQGDTYSYQTVSAGEGDDMTGVLESLSTGGRFGYMQYSTQYGRIYNDFYVDGDNANNSDMILDIENDLVYVKDEYDEWTVLEDVVPTDVFLGSHQSYNRITDQLWCSTGDNIFRISSSGVSTGNYTMVPKCEDDGSNEYILKCRFVEGAPVYYWEGVESQEK